MGETPRAGLELPPELHDHRQRLIAVEVRIEERQFRELRIHANLHVVWREVRRGVDERGVLTRHVEGCLKWRGREWVDGQREWSLHVPRL